MSLPTKHIYEFGPYRVDDAEHFLLREGQTVPLPPKAFDLLLALIEHRGHLLEKEQLLKLIWPDSFVEEANLSYNVSLIRKALGEGENGQRFIETVPKRGYRFAADVREVPKEEIGLIAKEQPGSQELAKARKGRFARPAVFITLSLAIGVSVWLIAFRHSPELLPPKIVHFTTFPGSEWAPAFSPDGNSIAFSWEGDKGDNRDIYIKQIGTESRFRLTTNPAPDHWPCWSPDGLHIAFIRPTATGYGLYLIPSLGGAERKISEISRLTVNPLPISWSPDGEWLAVTDKSSHEEPLSIFLVARETGQKRKLTSPPAATLGDLHPAISPDGNTVAFFRHIGSRASDLHLVPAAGGQPNRLTFDQSAATFPAWTPDGRYILFSSDRGGGSAQTLWRVSASGGTPEQIEVVGRYIPFAAISRQGNRLAWNQFTYDQNIWRMELTGAQSPTGRKPVPQVFIASTVRDTHPQFSPDGNKIVFTSDRSGSFEIWACDSDGQHFARLTFFGGSIVGSPRWSPDGRQIAFDSTADGGPDIYVVNAEGGKPHRLTTESSEDIAPSWSRDGQWIYFCSNRSGSLQVWKMPAAGGQAVQVTRQGGFDTVESPDGHFLYHTKGRGVPGIWRVPVAGGEVTLVVDHHRAGSWRHWAVVEDGYDFATEQQPKRPLIEFFSFATSKVRLIATVEKGLPGGNRGLAISPDGHWLIWSQLDQEGSDIMLMENFR